MKQKVKFEIMLKKMQICVFSENIIQTLQKWSLSTPSPSGADRIAAVTSRPASDTKTMILHIDVKNHMAGLWVNIFLLEILNDDKL